MTMSSTGGWNGRPVVTDVGVALATAVAASIASLLRTEAACLRTARAAGRGERVARWFAAAAGASAAAIKVGDGLIAEAGAGALAADGAGT